MPCVDAETLAAWADGGLSKADAAAVDVHLAECDRCTAMLATFVKTTPELPAVESLWHRWRLNWLVPIATAATAIALWVAIPRNQSDPNVTLDSAPATQAAPTAAPGAPPVAEYAPARPEAPAQNAAAEPQPAAANARAKSSTAVERARKEAPQREEASQVQAQPVAPPQVTSELRQVTPPQATPPQTAPAPLREADQKASDLRDAEGKAPAAQTANAVPAPAGDAVRRQGFRTLAGAAAVAQVQVISPDPAIRWRVVGPGQVERSTNGGTQWQPATLPESATITAGTSPSSTVCWLVGRTGAMYVTTDGLRFSRVAFPERTDFISIQAADARHATVVTIDGRTFRTEDQGQTWVRQ